MYRFFLAFSFFVVSSLWASVSPEFLTIRSFVIEVVGDSQGVPGLFSTLKTKEHEQFSQMDFDKDIKLLAKEFDRVEPNVQVSSDEVTIHIKAWKKPIIRNLLLKGFKSYDEVKLRGQLGSKSGALYDRQEFAKSLQKFRQFYVKRGFFEVEIDSTLLETSQKDQVDVEITIHEGRAGYIEEIRFENFSAEEVDEISERMFTKEYCWWLSWLNNQGTFYKDVFQQDEMTTLTYLQNKGYLDAKVSIDIAQSENRNDRIVVTIKAEKNQVYQLGTLMVEGNVLFDANSILSRTGLQEGQTYSPDAMREASKAITDMYGTKGYIDAMVVPDVRLRDNEKIYDLCFRVTEGKCFRVGMIEIIGNTQTDSRVILHETLLVPGSLFDTRLLGKTEARLRQIGYFKTVNVYAIKSSRLDAGSESFRDVHIEVEEIPTTSRLSAFVGWNSTQSIAGGMGISETNFKLAGLSRLFSHGLTALRGSGEYCAFNATVGTKQLSYTLSWTKPHVFDTPWVVGVDLQKQRNSYSAKEYTIQSRSAEINAKRPVNAFVNFGTHYRIRNSSIDLKGIKSSSDNKQLIEEAKRAGTISAVGVELIYNSTNHIVLPSNGTKSLLGVEFAGLGGNHHFLKMQYHNSFYFSPFQKGVWKFRADFEAIQTMLGTTPDKLPFDERLYLGGEHSIRGFRYNGVGPRFEDDKTTPRGGMTSVLFSAEYERPIWKRLSTFAFMDAGNVWWKTLSVGTLRCSPGFGLRFYISENAPLSFGMGFPMNANSKDDIQRFFFSIGVGF